MSILRYTAKDERKKTMDEDFDVLLKRYESTLKEMRLTLDAIEQAKNDSHHITEIHMFLKRFANIDEFVSFIEDIQNKFFYLKEALTTQEAAQYLGMTVSTLYKKTMHNELPFYAPCGKRLYFKRQELENWMLQNRHAANEEMQADASVSGKTNLYTAKRSKCKTKKKQKSQ